MANTNTIRSLCLKCDNNIPLLSIIGNRICIKCKRGYSDTVPIAEYLTSYTKEQRKCSYINRCPYHNEVVTKYDYKEPGLCDKCNTRDYDLIDYINIENKVEEAKEKIKKCNEHFDNYFAKLKKATIAQLNQQINEVEISYEKSIDINKKILSFIQIIVDNFKCDNYRMFTNFTQNVKLNIYPYIKDKGVQSVIDYFTNYNVHEVKEFYKIKSKDTDMNCNHINSLLNLKDGRIASCSKNGLIKIINPNKNFNCDMNILTHQIWVHSLCQIDNGNIVSTASNKNSSLMIFSISDNSYQLVHKIDIKYKNEYVLNVKVAALSDNRIATGNDSLLIFDGTSKTDKPIVALKERRGDIENILYLREKEIAVTATTSNKVSVWDVKNYQLVTIISDLMCYGVNEMLRVSHNKILFGLSLYNVDTFEEEKDFGEQLGSLYTESHLVLRDGVHLIGVSEEGFVMINMQTGENRIIYTAHKKRILDIKEIDDNTFITCGEDNTIRVWKY